MMLTTIFFLIIGLIIISGISFTALKDINNMKSLLSGKVSFYVSEAGMEDALYRIKNVIQITNNTISIDGNFSAITLQDNGNGTITVLSEASTSDFYKRIQANVVSGSGISFHYGIQAGNGGFVLDNSSNITGNVYSNGSVIGLSKNDIYGDVISSGSNGLVFGFHATGSVYSHIIGSSTQNATTIDKDAYYQTITTNTSVSGTKHSGSADQPTIPLPISDQKIQEWEKDALAGGIMNSSECDDYDSRSKTCTISENRTLGPKKIPFNLSIKNSSNKNKTLTVTGALWIVGNLDVSGQPTIQMSPNLGSTNIAIIADDPSNRSEGSMVTLGNGATFLGSGFPRSYVFIISQNNSAENGGSTIAINPQQSASALVVYASHGLIEMSQTVGVKEVTAYKISLSQSANVTYDTGLASTIFSSGPAGGFNIIDWTEI